MTQPLPNAGVARHLNFIRHSLGQVRNGMLDESIRLAHIIDQTLHVLQQAEINSSAIVSSVDIHKPHNWDRVNTYLQTDLFGGSTEYTELVQSIESWLEQKICPDGRTRQQVIRNLTTFYGEVWTAFDPNALAFDITAIRRFADEILHTSDILNHAKTSIFPVPQWILDLESEIPAISVN